MNKIKLITSLLFSCIIFEASGQAEEQWTKTYQENILWQQVTSLGHYVVCSPQNLMGINPSTGDVVWRLSEFGGVPAEMVEQVGSSPLISVNSGEEIYMIDPFTGQIKFNSKKAGVREIRDQFVLYKADGILISGRDASNKDILLMSSMSSGEVAWKIEDDFGRLVTTNELSDRELLIVTIFYNYKVNPQTGDIIWKNDVSGGNEQMEKMGALGGLLKQAAANMAQDVEFNVQFYKHPEQDVFYVASENESQSGFSQSDMVSYNTSYSAFRLQDGERVWEDPLEVQGRMGPVYFHERGLVIMPDNGSNTKINLYDYASKEGKWGKKGRGIKVKGGIYSYSQVSDEGLILVSRNPSGKNFLSYLDMNQGILTFDKPVKVDGEVVFSENTPAGLLYITTEEINILNKNEGSLVLDDPIRTQPSLVTVDNHRIFAYDIKDNVIKTLNKATGQVDNVSDEIKFDGKEDPEYLDFRGEGLFLTSSQNLALVDFNGSIIYQKYFEAPREPGIIRALRYAQAVRAAYIGAAAYTASAAFQTAGAQVKDEQPVEGAIAEGIGQAYGQLGDAATDFAKKSFAMANARFKATQEADDYMIILAKQDKGNALLKVDKSTGEVNASVDLGKDREPDYVMDGVTGEIFYKTDNKTITSYKLY